MIEDFIFITSNEDKNNGNINRAMMGRFCRLINDLEFRDLQNSLVKSAGYTNIGQTGQSTLLIRMGTAFP
jgi:hypothetical protein